MKNKNNSVRLLVLCALLVAMDIIFTRVLSVSTGFVRFNLGSLPPVLASILFGPAAGFTVGAVADIVGGLLSGYAINPLITLGAGVIGLLPGVVWRLLPNAKLTLRLALGVFAGQLAGSVIINSLALHLYYGYTWQVLAVRIPNSLILAVIEIIVLRALLQNRAFRTAAGLPD